MEKNKNYVKTNIAYCCYKKLMTEEELREVIGVSKDAYYNAKYPCRKTLTLRKIAEYFGYTSDEFWSVNLTLPKSLRNLDIEDKRDDFIRCLIRDIKDKHECKWQHIAYIEELDKIEILGYRPMYNKKLFKLEIGDGVILLLLGFTGKIRDGVWMGCKSLPLDVSTKLFVIDSMGNYILTDKYGYNSDYKIAMLTELILQYSGVDIKQWDEKEKREYLEELDRHGDEVGGWDFTPYVEEWMDSLCGAKYGGTYVFKRKKPLEKEIDEDYDGSFVYGYIFLKETEKRILDYIEKRSDATYAEIAKATGYSKETVKITLKGLRGRNVIEREGGKSTGKLISNRLDYKIDV